MKIEQALEKFLVQLEADGRSPHTIAQYRRHVRLLATWAHNVGLCGEISAITHEDIARFLSSPVARTRPDGSIKKASAMNCLRSSLCGFFRYCHRAGYIGSDPTRLTKRAICGTPPPRALSEVDTARLLEMLKGAANMEGHRDYALFHTMLATGIRLGSAVALNIEDVDLKAEEFWLRSAKNNTPTKVFLNHAISEHLKHFIGNRAAGPLFRAKNGKRISIRHVQRRFGGWLDKCCRGWRCAGIRW